MLCSGILTCNVSRFHSYLNSAVSILSRYDGREPFAAFLKKHFAANKKFGSKDRKYVTQLCYASLRLGKSPLDIASEERLTKGLFLVGSETNPLLHELSAEWDERITRPIEQKLFEVAVSTQQIFPWHNDLSHDVDSEQFARSFLIQPDLFLRIRPGQKTVVISNLENSEISYKPENENSVRLTNSFNAADYFELDNEVVIQDLNSQRVGELFPMVGETGRHVWDCCAASGGKSIMLHDIDPTIKITATDIRESIIANLRKRFEIAGVKNYKSFVVDISSTGAANIKDRFDCIIADVPCSGSGTWSRTPEQLAFFDERKIEQYAELQRKIVSNVVPHLKKEGYLLYITCSVFKKENEDNVQFIKDKFGLQSERVELFKGYDRKADTMFAALLRKE
jgi:16S rRNA (cytosine967-C5)-methyltransferase